MCACVCEGEGGDNASSPPHPTWRSSPVFAAHSLTVSSHNEPEARVVPSGEKATLSTPPVWPFSTWGAAGTGRGDGGRWGAERGEGNEGAIIIHDMGKAR